MANPVRNAEQLRKDIQSTNKKLSALEEVVEAFMKGEGQVRWTGAVYFQLIGQIKDMSEYHAMIAQGEGGNANVPIEEVLAKFSKAVTQITQVFEQVKGSQVPIEVQIEKIQQRVEEQKANRLKLEEQVKKMEAVIAKEKESVSAQEELVAEVALLMKSMGKLRLKADPDFQ